MTSRKVVARHQAAGRRFAVEGIGKLYLATMVKPAFRRPFYLQALQNRDAMAREEIDAYVDLLTPFAHAQRQDLGQHHPDDRTPGGRRDRGGRMVGEPARPA